jgi:hypothetical protein
MVSERAMRHCHGDTGRLRWALRWWQRRHLRPASGLPGVQRLLMHAGAGQHLPRFFRHRGVLRR